MKIGKKQINCKRCNELIKKGSESYFYGFLLCQKCFFRGKFIFSNKYQLDKEDKEKLLKWIKQENQLNIPSLIQIKSI